VVVITDWQSRPVGPGFDATAASCADLNRRGAAGAQLNQAAIDLFRRVSGEQPLGLGAAACPRKNVLDDCGLGVSVILDVPPFLPRQIQLGPGV
jgi:hypothetical protein